MSIVQIRVDTKPVQAALGTQMETQIPFAVSLWLNRLANAAQAAIRAHMKEKFHLRHEAFNLKAIYISKADRSTKTSWRVLIQVQERASYLDKFEEGGEKVALGGRRYLAIPNDKVFSDGIVEKGSPLRIKNLHLHKDEYGRVIGDQRTFLAPFRGAEGSAGIFQRISKDTRKGSAKSAGTKSSTADAGIQLLYKLVSRARIPAKLEFVQTVQDTVDTQSRTLLDDAFADAMRTAR